MTTSRVRGMEQLFANMRAFPKALQEQVLDPACRKAIIPMRAAAEALAPKLTGHLAGAVTMTKDKRPELEHMIVRYIVFVIYKGPRAATYWRYVEFGTSQMAPQPFMRPAFEANVNLATTIFFTEVARGVPRVLNGMSK